jgi:hypothetical protein
MMKSRRNAEKDRTQRSNKMEYSKRNPPFFTVRVYRNPSVAVVAVRPDDANDVKRPYSADIIPISTPF